MITLLHLVAFFCGSKESRAQSGQATTEYVVVVAVLIGIVTVFSTDALPFFPAIVKLFQIYIDGLYMVVSLPIP